MAGGINAEFRKGGFRAAAPQHDHILPTRKPADTVENVEQYHDHVNAQVERMSSRMHDI